MDLGAALEEERQFVEQHSKSKGRRVKIEKINQAWLVRFLPVQLGDRGLPWVRQGQHWVNKSPIFCPRWVATDFGGDPEADCPICRLADELNDMDNEELSSFGFRLRASVTYLTYCVVLQIDPGRGDVQDMPFSEIIRPWEFQHYKSSFDELHDYFKRGRTAKRPYSVMDLENGNDFWATKTKKGIRLDRQDPGPILELDANYEKNLDTIFSAISNPKIKIPNAKELETFARKAEAAAYKDDEGGGDRGGSRRGRALDEDEGTEDERPSRRVGRAAPPAARRGAAPAADPAEGEAEGAEGEAETPQDEDQVPGAEVPPARAPARTVAPAATRPATTRPASTAPARTAPAATQRPPARPAATTAPARTAPAAAAAQRPPARASAPAAATAPARTTAAPAPARKPAQAPVAARRPAPAAEAPSSVDEEEDPGVAEEATDQAGPAAEALPENEAGGEEQPGEEGQAEEGQPGEEGQENGEPAAEDEAPPAPARGTATAPPSGGLRSRLMNRVSRVPQK